MKKTILLSLSTALLLASLAQAESISINFGADRREITDSPTITAGAIPVVGDNWNEADGATDPDTIDQLAPGAVIDSTGAIVTGLGVDWTSSNTWNSGAGASTATSYNADLTKGYLDDSDAGWTVTVSGVPYLTYDAYIIHATDQGGGTENADATMAAVQVNGQYFRWDGSATSMATGYGDTWVAKNWTNDDTLTQGQHYLMVSGPSSTTLSLAGDGAGGGYRSAIAGLQIDNTYTGALSYWDIDGPTAGPGGIAPAGTWDGATANWSTSSTGEAATTTWTSGNAAVFSAGSDATDPYTITVDGTQSADAVWAKDGAVTLSGGTIDLGAGGSGVLRGDTALNVESVVAGSSGLNSHGNVALKGASTYTGDTVVRNGTLSLNAGEHVVVISKSSQITVNPGATLSVLNTNALGRNSGNAAIVIDGGTLDHAGGNHEHLNDVTLKNGATWKATSGGSYDGENAIVHGTISVQGTSASTIGPFAAGLALDGVREFNVADVTSNSDVDLTVAAELENSSAGVNKTGDGTMRISSAATYGGATQVNGGTLIVATQIRGSSSFAVAAGATLEFGGTNIFVGNHGTAMADSRVITVNGGTLLMNTAFNARFGNVTLNDGATWTSNRVLTNYDALLADVSSGAATVAVTGTGASIMNGAGGIHLGGVQNFDVADTTGDGGADLVVEMVLDGPGSFGGSGGVGGVNKLGEGTMTINTNPTYNGTTTITAGTLLVNATHTGGDAYTVAGGATFGGDGSTDAAVTVEALGILAPGNSPGSLATGALALADTSILDFELAAPNAGITTDSDRIDVTGDLTLDGVLDVAALTGFGTPVQGDQWLLLTYTGALTDNSLTVGAAPLLDTGLSYAIDTTTTGEVNLTVVPEPSTLLLATLGLLGLFGLGRRHRR
jgi:fibronectin-binding autotransporter adhesin